MATMAPWLLVVLLATVIGAGLFMGRRYRSEARVGSGVSGVPVAEKKHRFWQLGRARKEAERLAAQQARIDSLERTIAYYDQRLSKGAESEFFVRWATEQRGLAEQELERLRAA
jgi:hypothetical protein